VDVQSAACPGCDSTSLPICHVLQCLMAHGELEGLMEGLCGSRVSPGRLRLPTSDGVALFADAIVALHRANK